MKRSREDNTVSVIQRAVRHLRIPVTKGSVKEALKSHTYYPTFKSICDTFNEWKVEYYPLKYEPEELLEIPAPYIVHFKTGGGQVAFVSEIKNNMVTYFESYNFKKVIDIKEYLERCSGAVILLNPDERSGEKDYREKWQNEMIGNAVLPVVGFVLLLFIVLSLANSFARVGIEFDMLKGMLLFTKTAGIVLSVLLDLI